MFLNLATVFMFVIFDIFQPLFVTVSYSNVNVEKCKYGISCSINNFNTDYCMQS